jgi:ankyrin repeat protein
LLWSRGPRKGRQLTLRALYHTKPPRGFLVANSRGMNNPSALEPVDERDDRGWAPLHHAAARGEAEVCRNLFHMGADPDSRTGVLVRDGDLRRDWYYEPGETPLMLATENGHSDVVSLLLELGAHADLHDNTQWGAVHAAVAGGRPEHIELLTRAGADINLQCSRRSLDEELGWFFVITPLHLAALRSDAAAAEALMRRGADIAACWIDRRTPLIYAAARGATAVVELLCARGADPNAREHRYEHGYFIDMTPLHYAARNGHADTSAALLRLGAEPKARDSHSGLTAEEFAAERTNDQDCAGVV